MKDKNFKSSLKDKMTDDQLDRLDLLRENSPILTSSGPVRVYAKAFQDLETGDVFFLKHSTLGGGSTGEGVENMGQKRDQTVVRPSRFLGDVLVDEQALKGWSRDFEPTIYLGFTEEPVLLS